MRRSLPPALQNANQWTWLPPGTPLLGAAMPAVRSWDDAGPAEMIAVSADADESVLSTAVARRPEALVVSGCRSAEDVGRLAARLAVVEAALDIADGETGLVILLDQPAGVLASAAIASASRRVLAIGLDQAGLAEALGLPSAAVTPALATARGLVLLAAAAAGQPTIARLRTADMREIEAARADGFAILAFPPRIDVA